MDRGGAMLAPVGAADGLAVGVERGLFAVLHVGGDFGEVGQRADERAGGADRSNSIGKPASI